MSPRRNKNTVPLSLRVIQEWEQRVFQQKLLILSLKVGGRSIKEAETDLKRYQGFLGQLLNHHATMLELLTIDPRLDKPIAMSLGARRLFSKG